MAKSLRIADLACGTGTLLSAAYQSILSRYRRAGGDGESLHRTMMEESLIAADIMPAAAHLTVSMLSSVYPKSTFEDTKVHLIRYGEQALGTDIGIGSLDLLDSNYGYDLFDVEVESVKGREKNPREGDAEKAALFNLRHDSLDIVIMNPPFTAPTNHALTEVPVPSFAGFGTSADEQRLMSEKLKRIKKKCKFQAGHGNAGLASNFLDLAHVKLRVGGTLAMVMPLALIMGKAWENGRRLLAQSFEQIILVSIGAKNTRDRAFSADTDMAEVLVVAKKRKPVTITEDEADAYFMTLYQRPQTRAEAVEIARSAHRLIVKKQNAGTIKLGNENIGNIIKAPLSHGGCASVIDMDLVECVVNLESGKLILPGTFRSRKLCLTRLGDLGTRGLVHRDINGKDMNTGEFRGPFEIEDIILDEQVTFPVLWGHDAPRERSLIVEPDKKATIRVGMEEKAAQVFRGATNLHFALGFRLGSQSLAACWTIRKSIGGSAWPNFSSHDSRHEKAILLWANTSLGLMLYWWRGSKQHTGRAIITITGLPALKMLDTRKLTLNQCKHADKIFDEFSSREFMPAYKAYEDKTRIDLDKAVLVDLLDFPDDIMEPLDLLRRKWCAEPTVHGNREGHLKGDPSDK